MNPSHPVSVALVATVLLCACGGHDSTPAPSASSSGSSSSGASGVLIQVAPAAQATLSATTLAADLTGASTQSVGTSTLAGILDLTGTPKCDVSIYHIEYNTVGGQGEATSASGALMVPNGGDSSCSGALPIVEYAHGTTTAKTYDISNLSSQNGGPNAEGLLIAAFFAARGYIVVAPNYAGYDTSTLPYHPYLIRDQQAADMIAALTAARAALLTVSTTVTDGGQFFITGYSQGGFVAMATQRAMEAAGMSVTASAPMSGPYALAAFADADFYGEVSAAGVEVSTLLLDAYQNSYGNLYSSLTDVINTPYALANFTTLLPTATPIVGAPTALFDSTAPSSSYAAQTPPIMPAYFAPVYAQGFGTEYLISNFYRLAWLQDEAANPDGGFPSVTSGMPTATAQVAWRADLTKNDLRTPTPWVPKAPTLLCGGENDPEVYFFNTALMENYWSVTAPATSVAYLDIDPGTPAAVATGRYGTLQTDFQDAKAAFMAVEGPDAVYTAYHVRLVAPFCLASTIYFFDNLP